MLKGKIYIAGHRGLVGSALVRTLRAKGYDDLILKTREELDLLDAKAVDKFYKKESPDVVILAAAKVGGIQANNTQRADFIYQNLMIQNNVIWGAYKAGVKRLVCLGSSCIYPKNAPQPMPESCLLSSPLELTNRPYAVAKIAGLELVNSLRNQYGCDYFSVMPTNLYGINDNFHPVDSHVLPAFLRRVVEAKDEKELVIWGSGTPKREFLFSDDCAEAIVFLLEQKKLKFPSQYESHINIGSGQEISILDLVLLISKIVGFKGVVLNDPSKPDGTMRKLLDSGILNTMGWAAKTPLEDGIRKTLDWYHSGVNKRM
jgi:GDP-L-fucose synthase